ncbi:hypothetical protein [Synechococcus sp. BA-132 BA5]|uniref:hypothetical protein n=1 Tax=Synechococcus sp. BA-132 BA5 TaxID=3110252 RepID=UPI002B1EBE4A|nr:hypothetical protein [Synechococcus sp. BA-132 BA5]MEA5414024.1 hypothetical protein [Synechococcus sp. BA-132 BA5]
MDWPPRLLAKQGCSKRKINTVVGPWGFNLVLQATAIGPNQLNFNVRFEGL